jgi:osmotically inducible protein OsmC
MKSTGTAHWSGGLKDGKGSLSVAGGALRETPYSFARRFEDERGPGTSPEELVAATHAACFAMATSAMLGQAGFTPTRLDAKATVTLQPVDGKPTVTGSHLELTAVVPGIDEAKFREIVEGAKSGCVVSRLLKTDVTLDATLAQG